MKHTQASINYNSLGELGAHHSVNPRCDRVQIDRELAAKNFFKKSIDGLEGSLPFGLNATVDFVGNDRKVMQKDEK